MRRFGLVFLFGFLAFVTSQSCINEFRTLLSGDVVASDALSGRVSAKTLDTNGLYFKGQDLLKRYKTTDSIELLSDYGVTLIYREQYSKSRNIYHQIEKTHPGLYTTASNLGTAYELMGKPDSAHYWIKKSMELNPESHKGSEWIHLKILEYQMAKNPDPEASILGLDFGTDVKPQPPVGIDLLATIWHIRHQLKERLVFVKPPNTIVGNIYFDLGNAVALKWDVEAALDCYEAAEEFGFHSPILSKRQSHMQALGTKASARRTLEKIVRAMAEHPVLALSVLGILFFGAVYLLIIFIRKMRRRKGKKESK